MSLWTRSNMLKNLNLKTIEDLSDTEAELITEASPTLPLPPPASRSNFLKKFISLIGAIGFSTLLATPALAEYWLRSDGAIWTTTYDPGDLDTPDSYGSQQLDNNSNTKAITAGSYLYQLHNNGAIWQYTGRSCSGNSCPGWVQLDGNPNTKAIVAYDSNLYQLHNNGAIWKYTGTPCSSSSCSGWVQLDYTYYNPNTKAIVAGSFGNLYKLHNDGAIWKYTGTPCSSNSCSGWQKLDNNSNTKAIVASRGSLYQLHNNGAIWKYTGTPCSSNSCSGWQKLDNNSNTKTIAAGEQDGSSYLYQLHNNGAVWRYTGTPCSSNSCPGWQQLDNNLSTIAIVAGGIKFSQLYNDGTIWRDGRKLVTDPMATMIEVSHISAPVIK